MTGFEEYRNSPVVKAIMTDKDTPEWLKIGVGFQLIAKALGSLKFSDDYRRDGK